MVLSPAAIVLPTFIRQRKALKAWANTLGDIIHPHSWLARGLAGESPGRWFCDKQDRRSETLWRNSSFQKPTDWRSGSIVVRSAGGLRKHMHMFLRIIGKYWWIYTKWWLENKHTHPTLNFGQRRVYLPERFMARLSTKVFARQAWSRRKIKSDPLKA